MLLVLKAASTGSLASVVSSLTWQVTHHAAVKSTNTVCPLSKRSCTAVGVHVCHRAVLDAVFELIPVVAEDVCVMGPHKLHALVANKAAPTIRHVRLVRAL